MALRHEAEAPTNSSAGEQLLVVHDFKARSADELTISKGERIQLIERDDDFGDGWYLGKHIEDGRVGLFPEVYTTRAPPKAPTSPPQAELGISPQAQLPLSPNHLTIPTPSDGDAQSVLDDIRRDATSPEEHEARVPPTTFVSYTTTPSPLNTGSHTPRIASVPAGFPSQAKVALSPVRSMSLMMDGKRAQGQESPVMNETLSVIDEHITDMHTPRSSLLAPGDRRTNDSGSDYSNYVDRRLSYINGDETDEEERNAHSEEAVMRWSPAQVATQLKELGVETRHCEIFKEQEISGEVLLAMDQVSVFMKELDLGLVGRRLRTWHKIKAFQEEVQAHKASSIRSAFYGGGGDGNSDDLDQSASQSSASASVRPRIPSLLDHSSAVSSPRHERKTSLHAIPQNTQAQQDSPLMGQSQHHRFPSQPELLSESSKPPITITTRPPESPSRPSAASIRELNHSRRHSSMERRIDPQASTPLAAQSHKKSPSFDRSWTMGNLAPAVSGRSVSAIGITALGMGGHALSPSLERSPVPSSVNDFSQDLERAPDLDRGYMSGGEADTKRFRNVLRKREMANVTHSRQGSFNQDKSGNVAVSNKRHSRFGSAGSISSIRDTISSITSPSFKSSSSDARPRSSTVGARSHERSNTPPEEDSSPLVTRLEYPESTTASAKTSPRPSSSAPGFGMAASGHISASASKSRPLLSAKADSDSATIANHDVASTASTSFSPGQDPVPTPSRTASVTTSVASKSIENDSPNVSSKNPSSTALAMTPAAANTRSKSKKNTSAYTRGLQKRTPQEQMVDCDYSGWMKKKSPSLLTTWKPRLFILRGRRLSYYYSENDTEEKGLIDISSHRVLPADNEIVAGLHATFTGAKSSPTSPANAHTPTINATESAAQEDSSRHSPGMSSMFIFKLVPPRAGLSRAVNFTKPTVHYFAVDNVKQGRLWMAALMKATIDRDEGKGIITTYQQKTISLAKARAMKHRPPALMGPEDSDRSNVATPDGEKAYGLGSLPEPPHSGLNIQGLKLSYEYIVTEAQKELASQEAANSAVDASPVTSVSLPQTDPLPSLVSPMAYSISSSTITPSTAVASPNLPPEAQDVHVTPASTSPVMSPPGAISLTASAAAAAAASPQNGAEHAGETFLPDERTTGSNAGGLASENSPDMDRKEVLFAAMNTMG